MYEWCFDIYKTITTHIINTMTAIATPLAYISTARILERTASSKSRSSLQFSCDAVFQTIKHTFPSVFHLIVFFTWLYQVWMGLNWEIILSLPVILLVTLYDPLKSYLRYPAIIVHIPPQSSGIINYVCDRSSKLNDRELGMTSAVHLHQSNIMWNKMLTQWYIMQIVFEFIYNSTLKWYV